MDKEARDIEVNDLTNDIQKDDPKWCFAWFAETPAPEPGTKEKAALLKAAKWNPGGTITVSFLDGDAEVQNRVKKVAMEWVTPGPANLKLDFRNNTNETDIRISFSFAGSWSMIGTTCRNVTDKTKPTMNYGWLNKDTRDEELRRVVLHEFGHALGLTHEHMSPAGGIKWNRERVIKDLSGPPNKWSLQQIENNMFRTFDKKETNFTALDIRSIMMYPIPKEWITEGEPVGLNTELSDKDKTFIREQYS